MNEKLNLVEILKDCPKGTKLYSTILGEVKLYEVRYSTDTYPICIETMSGSQYWLTSDGRYMNCYDEECTLFPSKEQRDWSKFKQLVKPKFKVGDKIVYRIGKLMGASGSYGIISEITDDKYIFTDTSYAFIRNQDGWELVSDKKPKFDPKTLCPFDRVLVRDRDVECWRCSLFSHIINVCVPYEFHCISSVYKYCIPYNDDTKHLVGTADEAPEFYRYWEE